jgi:hypothetical protein
MPGPKFNFTATGLLSRSSNSVGTNQEEMPGPVAMACQTSSGVPGDLDFDLDGTASGWFFLYAHDGSFRFDLELDFCGSGCATTTRRCARPPGAD